MPRAARRCWRISSIGTSADDTVDVSLRETQPLAEREAYTECPQLIAGTFLPIAYARWVIDHEWVTKLDDLVERRLMLLYHPALRRKCLEQLADLLIEAGKLQTAEKTSAVDAVIRRLQSHFGKNVTNQ